MLKVVGFVLNSVLKVVVEHLDWIHEDDAPTSAKMTDRGGLDQPKYPKP